MDDVSTSIKAKISDLAAGDVVWLVSGYSGNRRDLVKVTRVARKYIYVKQYGSDSPFDKVTGWARDGCARLQTAKMRSDVLIEQQLDAVIKCARLGQTYYYSSGWSLEDKQRLVALLHELGKVDGA